MMLVVLLMSVISLAMNIVGDDDIDVDEVKDGYDAPLDSRSRGELGTRTPPLSRLEPARYCRACSASRLATNRRGVNSAWRPSARCRLASGRMRGWRGRAPAKRTLRRRAIRRLHEAAAWVRSDDAELYFCTGAPPRRLGPPAYHGDDGVHVRDVLLAMPRPRRHRDAPHGNLRRWIRLTMLAALLATCIGQAMNPGPPCSFDEFDDREMPPLDDDDDDDLFLGHFVNRQRRATSSLATRWTCTITICSWRRPRLTTATTSTLWRRRLMRGPALAWRSGWARKASGR